MDDIKAGPLDMYEDKEKDRDNNVDLSQIMGDIKAGPLDVIMMITKKIMMRFNLDHG